jgi:hypothetical protein
MSWHDKYVLTDDHRVVVEPDLLTWARWFETADRHVGHHVIGTYRVSTIFLGLNFDYAALAYRIDRPPMVFETAMIDHAMEKPSFKVMAQYPTWDKAKTGHDRYVQYAQRLLRWMAFREARLRRILTDL